jgi:hypothetical protein
VVPLDASKRPVSEGAWRTRFQGCHASLGCHPWLGAKLEVREVGLRCSYDATSVEAAEILGRMMEKGKGRLRLDSDSHCRLKSPTLCHEHGVHGRSSDRGRTEPAANCIYLSPSGSSMTLAIYYSAICVFSWSSSSSQSSRALSETHSARHFLRPF